ncbi:class F sortase [Nocardioides carbamazepini]|uniref:class F sortase n=1 Tax=Nocardioides carbamazepini TaxID=2854259 RepID=UPI00214A1639|nr:class F sortase [Nocardioides carbamazepini]MCR1784665.1 class F sortase [Nocardioides carbamazepini]
MAAALAVAAALGGVAVPGADAVPVERVRAAAACTTPAGPFSPATTTIPAIGRSVSVTRVRRTPSGAVGTPPVTQRGKWLMGLDPQIRPGEGKGTVIMAAHTWPDNSALGNALLRRLAVGDRLVLANGNGSATACYQVTKRKKYGATRVPRKKAFRWWGPEQLVIVVCSGKRLGPGRWTHRTIWYATPVSGGAVTG